MQHREALPANVAQTVQHHIIRAMVRIHVYDEWRVENGSSYMASWWFGFVFNCVNVMNRRTVNDWTIWVGLLLWAHQTWTAVKIAYVAQRASASPSRQPADEGRQRGNARSPEEDALYQQVYGFTREFVRSGPGRLRL
jgi:hypothetical protein